jgi:hypothetical protein
MGFPTLDNHNILELVFGRPSKRNHRQQWTLKFGRTISIDITCVTKVIEMHMWQGRSEHNNLETE